jgi:hypothetical protein
MLEQRDMLGQQTPVVERSLEKDTDGIRYAKNKIKRQKKYKLFYLSMLKN